MGVCHNSWLKTLSSLLAFFLFVRGGNEVKSGGFSLFSSSSLFGWQEKATKEI